MTSQYSDRSLAVSFFLLVLCLFTMAAADQPAPAPALSSDPNKCDCNPSAQAVSGVCVPFKLPTAWSCQVDPNNPLPEYPRPQLMRPEFQSLNGIWEWERADTWDSGPVPINRTLQGSIVVPYPMEGDLSGISPQNRTGVSRMWYRRRFRIAKDLSQGNKTRIKLNFGAVDWESEVWVNEFNLGVHRGGYDKFSYDITEALTKGDNGTHELIVRVFDPTEYAHIPLGKQRRVVPSTDIFYTSTSGIWQTVWLEPVNAAHVTRLDLIPDIDSSSLRVLVHGSNSTDGLPVQVDIYLPQNGTVVASAQGLVAKPFNVTIPNQRLWWPDDPFLYDVRVKILHTPSTSSFGLSLRKALPVVQQTATSFDEVTSYIGMKKISLGKSTPMSPLRIFVNNIPLFLFGTLDQGFHPDGMYTAATDDALFFDIQAMKDMGMNMIRKHIKVEPDRWYYHADRLGMLVWQDMVSMYWEKPWLEGEQYRTSGEKAQFEEEMRRMVEEHYSSPSVGIYTVFNEGWGQFDTQRMVQLGHEMDPSRLWDAASGWIDPQDRTAYPPGGDINKPGPWMYHYTGYVGDLRDDHNYPDAKASGATQTRANVAGEYGGLGTFTEGHTWVDSTNKVFKAYPLMDNTTQFQSEFIRYLHMVKDLAKSSSGLSAAVYTEVTDVEDEVNGLYTYDRQVLKFPDPEAVAKEIKDLVSMSVV